MKAIKTKLKTIFKDLDNREKLQDFNEIALSNIVVSYPKTNLKIKINDFVVNKNDKISITGQSGQGKQLQLI